MKSIFSKTTALLLSALLGCAVSSCENNKGGETPIPSNSEVKLTFVERSADNIIVDVTPLEGTTRYAVYPMESATYDAEYSASANDAAGWIASTIGQDPTTVEYTAEVHSAAARVELGLSSTLKPETAYTVLAFPINESNQLSGKVATLKVTTDSPLGSLVSVTVSDIEFDNAYVQVDAGTFTGNYIVAPFSADGFQEQFGGDFTKAAEAIVAIELDEYGTDLGAVGNGLVYNTDANFYLIDANWIIRSQTDYYVIAFGVEPNGTIVGEVIHSELFTTPKAPEMSFQISTTSITNTSANVIVTPSDNTMEYFVTVLEAKVVEGRTDQEIIENFENYHGPAISAELVRGQVQAQLKELKQGTEYKTFVMGYSSIHGRTTELITKSFTTLGEADPVLDPPTSVTIPDVEFGTLVVTHPDAFYCNFTATSLNEGMKYILMVLPTAEFNSYPSHEELIIANMNFFEEYSFTALTTFQNILPFVAFGGSSNSTFSELTASTEYTMFAYGIDITTAQPLTKVATTQFTTLSEEESSEENLPDTAAPALPTAVERPAPMSLTTEFTSISNPIVQRVK